MAPAVFGQVDPMLRQLIFGSAVSLGNIAIHAATMMVIIRSKDVIHANVGRHPTLRLVGIMIAAVSMLMAAHLLEVAIWAAAYSLLGATPKARRICILPSSTTQHSAMAISFR